MTWLLFLKNLPFCFNIKIHLNSTAHLFTENHSPPEILFLISFPLLLSTQTDFYPRSLLGAQISFCILRCSHQQLKRIAFSPLAQTRGKTTDSHLKLSLWQAPPPHSAVLHSQLEMSLFFVLSIATSQVPNIPCLDFFNNLAVVFSLIPCTLQFIWLTAGRQIPQKGIVLGTHRAQVESNVLKSPANAVQTRRYVPRLSE